MVHKFLALVNVFEAQAIQYGESTYTHMVQNIPSSAGMHLSKIFVNFHLQQGLHIDHLASGEDINKPLFWHNDGCSPHTCFKLFKC